MIVSASYRTDIPAFYADWFLNRVAAGAVRFRNPFGGGIVTVSLKPADVSGIVFWTRNFAPLLERLGPVAERGWPFVVQFTVTGYPRPLEPSTIRAEDAAAQIARIARRFGPRAAVWRYDPVLLSALTGPDWHRDAFARIAGMLRGHVDEAVISFVEPYRKTRRNLDRLARDAGLDWRLPEPEEKADIVRDLAAVAGDAGMALTLCTQPALAERVAGIAAPARCIDAGRLGDVAGRPVIAPAKGNRPGCLCAASRDIGAYDTCPHGCAYCYAVADRARAKAAYAAHDDSAEMLGVR
ncbi:MAG: DUF1848 domain-containing protein [Rhodospirillaceae bacterium]|nr:DUF1848 domain-containing protein [Rhodospirillaceae bacterium]MYB15107.1 DUF1848 domain-containing protein [Rhodospirillaceae bacterium]MYI51058.1 DUF1848 domain-containing protein [Rhodospirillaceae bacterium]